MNLAVFASGNGSNLQAIIKACRKGKITANLKLVFSDRPAAYALTRARRAKVPAIVSLLPRDFASREAYDQACVELLQREQIDLVVLAGYMRILSPLFIEAFRGRIMNIHPSLLPAFKGGHAIEDALAYGVRVTGVTVHFVDEQIDHGPIIAQSPVSIFAQDTCETLAARIHRAEHRLYPQVVELFVSGKLKVSGRTVIPS